MISGKECAPWHYGRLSDQGAVDLAQSGDVRAAEHLLYKYRSLVRT